MQPVIRNQWLFYDLCDVNISISLKKRGEQNMKRLFEITLVLIMLFALVACKTTETLDANEPAPQPAPTPVSEPEPVAAETAPEQKGIPVFDPIKGVIPGVLYQLNPVEGQEPVIKAVSLAGNRAGDEINRRELSVDNIRFVFELNEWISITADSEKKDGQFVVILPHAKDPDFYTEDSLQAIPDNASYVNLDPTDEGMIFGETYVYDFNNPGFYDLVFADNAKPVALILIRLFEEGQVEGISDAELEKYMTDAAEEAKSL